MKRFFILVSFSAFAFSVKAQEISKDDIALIQSAFGKDKGELVRQYMNIPAEKATAFREAYDKYEEERRAIGRKKIKLIQDYANNYATLDDKKAGELFKQKMNLADEFTGLQKKHFSTISKVLGGVQAAKFFQLEDYLNNIINLGIQENIPFIGEIDKTMIKQ